MQFSINTYIIFLYGEESNQLAQIVLENDTSSQTANMYFIKSGNPIPNNVISSNLRSGNAYYSEVYYERFIDMLRNEKPVRFFMGDRNPRTAVLYTGEEEIGEEES